MINTEYTYDLRTLIHGPTYFEDKRREQSTLYPIGTHEIVQNRWSIQWIPDNAERLYSQGHGVQT